MRYGDVVVALTVLDRRPERQDGARIAFSASAREGCDMEKDDLWLPTLKTDTPQGGIELAVKLSDLGFLVFERSEDRRPTPRKADRYARSQLIAAAHVIALNFQTIAAANDWWRHQKNPNGQ